MRDLERQDLKRPWRLTSWRSALAMLAVASACVMTLKLCAQTDDLPNAPSALLYSSDSNLPSPNQADAGLPDEARNQASADENETDSVQPNQRSSAPATTAQPPAQTSKHKAEKLPPCSTRSHDRAIPIIFLPSTEPTCEDQLQLIVDTGYIRPLTSTQKGVLAIRALIDPFNLLTIATFSGISVAANSHSVYGPGLRGWGKLSGYSLAEDAQVDLTGIYVIPSLVHEDPRYHRMPKASVGRRIAHALIHTVVSQHDDGALMPNYATLINIPLSAEISNLYVPDIGTNAPDTAKRVLVGYATDPIGPLVAEFLPDFAKRVHVHIIFAQQILNRLALGSGASSSSY
ncbi:MAG: hypothetical protein WBY53_17735 [Acidobacteriaceae bacterium]